MENFRGAGKKKALFYLYRAGEHGIITAKRLLYRFTVVLLPPCGQNRKKRPLRLCAAAQKEKKQGKCCNLTAQIICVGTELLLGDVVNTNAADIARLLASLGIGVYHQSVVGDNPARLTQELDAAFAQCDLVLLSGGLGPTYDDLTKQTVAKWFGKELVLDTEEEKKLRAFFEHIGRPMTENNLQQVMMPEGCIVLKNPNGTAPGCIIEGKGKAAVLMPGPPRELIPMLNGPVLDWLQKRTSGVYVSRVLNFFGIGESELEQRLRAEIEHMENPTVASYAHPGEVQLRITARGPDEDACRALIAPVEKTLRERFARYCYGADYHDLQEAVVRVYRARGLHLAVAESCTGGLLASRLVEIPGASDMFGFGVVSYSEEAKRKILGVKAETLAQYTAVSAQCAAEMAEGVRALSGAEVGVATTGYAGPEGDRVGLVYVAAADGEKTTVRELHLARGRADDREAIRLIASSWALRLALMSADHNTMLLERGASTT